MRKGRRRGKGEEGREKEGKRKNKRKEGKNMGGRREEDQILPRNPLEEFFACFIIKIKIAW